MPLIRQEEIGSGTQVGGGALDRSMDSPFHVTGNKAKDVGTNADRWPGWWWESMKVIFKLFQFS